MSTLQSLQNEALIKQTCSEVTQNLLLLLSESQIWLTIEEYSQYHGVSKSSVEKAVANGMINVNNGGLKEGSDKPKARKLIFRFFNHLSGRINYPKLLSD